MFREPEAGAVIAAAPRVDEFAARVGEVDYLGQLHLAEEAASSHAETLVLIGAEANLVAGELAVHLIGSVKVRRLARS